MEGSIYKIEVAHMELGTWKVEATYHTPANIPPEEWLPGLAMHVCHLANLTGAQPEAVVQAVMTYINAPGNHIFQTFDEEAV